MIKNFFASMAVLAMAGAANAQVGPQGGAVAGTSSPVPGSSGPVGTLNGLGTDSNLGCGRVSLAKYETAVTMMRAHAFEAAAKRFEDVRSMPRCETDVVIFLSGVAEFHSGDLGAARALLERAINIRDPRLTPDQINHAREMVAFIDSKSASS